MVTALDRLFLGNYSIASATANSWGASAWLAQRLLTDWSSAAGFIFNGPNAASITIDSNTITAGSGNARIFAGIASLVPVVGSTPGLISGFSAYPSGLPGVSSTANFNYALGFGPLGVLQPWKVNETAPSKYNVDANLIYGGSGTNIIYGSIGDDVVHAGSGTGQIGAGWGFNTIYGGTAANPAGLTDTIVFNRATDKVILSNIAAIAASALNTSPASPNLPATWTSVLGTNLASVMTTALPAQPVGQGITVAPQLKPVVPYIAPEMQAAAPGLLVSGAGSNFFSATSIPPVDPVGPNFSKMVNAGFLLSGGSRPVKVALAPKLALDPALVLAALGGEEGNAGAIIKAMRSSEIVVKTSEAESPFEEAIAWLFDETEGFFAPAGLAPVVIEADSAPAQKRAAAAVELSAYESCVIRESWLAAMARLSRDTARNLFSA